MPDTQWKREERWWARLWGGQRHPSQGTSHPDISGDYYVAECKTRLFEDYSAEFKKAIKQMDENSSSHPLKISFICLSLYERIGRRLPTRHFIIAEIERLRQADRRHKITFMEAMREAIELEVEEVEV